MDRNDVYKKKKKKKHNKKYEEYDYSEIHCDEYDLQAKMKKMAEALEYYKDYIETYTIFEGITEEEWEKNMQQLKKLIKKLKKGDPSVFDIDALNDMLDSGHQLVFGMD